MNQKNGRTDPGPLRERARSLFISQATIDETLEWATPRLFCFNVCSTGSAVFFRSVG